jgi:hypothetical protein
VIVSSSVERILLAGEFIFCWDAAVAHVSAVLSEGVVSCENRCRDILALSTEESRFSRDFSVSTERRRDRETYTNKSVTTTAIRRTFLLDDVFED